MSYTLYYSPDSANLVVRMVLEELQQDYQAEEVPRKRTDRTVNFFALNPRGLLPVLVDHETGGSVFETGAVTLYLADKHNSLVPAPSSPDDRGDCLKWLFMISNTLHADLAMTFYAERYADSDENAQRVRDVSAGRVSGHFALLDEVIAKSQSEWFLPTGLSICDFYLGCCVRWAQIYPSVQSTPTCDDVKGFPALTALLRRVEQRESVKTALTKEGITGTAFIDPVSPLPVRVPDSFGEKP